MKQKREKLLFVVGGPGGSGSSTISKMLAEHFNIPRIYAGDLFREKAKQEDIDSFEEFLQEISNGGNSLDLEIDALLFEYAKKGNVLIESKVFAALAKKKGIKVTASIWLESDLKTRVRRKIQKEKRKGLFKKFKARRDLKKRYGIDKEKYARLYNVRYDLPHLYYDIVLDTSKLDEVETFNLILEKLKDGQYIKE